MLIIEDPIKSIIGKIIIKIKDNFKYISSLYSSKILFFIIKKQINHMYMRL